MKEEQMSEARRLLYKTYKPVKRRYDGGLREAFFRSLRNLGTPKPKKGGLTGPRTDSSDVNQDDTGIVDGETDGPENEQPEQPVLVIYEEKLRIL